MTAHTDSTSHYDVAVIGGGIAGLWVHNRLLGAGYRSVLLEASQLGSGQTLASQGMIHGGVKYVLGSRLTHAADVLARMPARWRLCLAGLGEINLRNTRKLAEHSYLWSNDRLLGELGTLLASRLLRGRAVRLPRQRFPELLRNPAFRGVVYELDDVILDITSLVNDLHTQANRRAPTTFQLRLQPSALERDGQHIRSIHTPGGRISANQYVFAAGSGNADLSPAPMQLRPLHQVWIELGAAAGAGEFFGHCITAVKRPEPRVTISSHRRANGDHVWYLGGALAGDGVARDADAQRAAAISTLGACLPWLNIGRQQVHLLRIDRAEALHADGQRPDEAYVQRHANSVTCWPTKLTLVPDVGDRVLQLLDPPAGLPLEAPPALAPATVGVPPWERLG